MEAQHCWKTGKGPRPALTDPQGKDLRVGPEEWLSCLRQVSLPNGAGVISRIKILASLAPSEPYASSSSGEKTSPMTQTPAIPTPFKRTKIYEHKRLLQASAGSWSLAAYHFHLLGCGWGQQGHSFYSIFFLPFLCFCSYIFLAATEQGDSLEVF